MDLLIFFMLAKLTSLATAAEKKFDLEFEFGHATPDCVERDPVVLTNGQFPGPTLTVNAGDLVTVNVRNRLQSVALNVHFHGVHQKGTPWSDGGTYYNSCPVSPNQDFVYQFRAPEQPGTYFYHGHVGLARELGAQGLFIVNPRSGHSWPDSMKHDEARNFLIKDWYHAPGLSLTTGVLQKNFRWAGDPQSILVNGKGMFDCANNVVYQCVDEECEVEDPNQPNICTALERPYFMPSYRWGKGHPGGHCGPENCDGPDIVKVTKGKTYLFRFANAATLSLFNVAVEGHKMTVVSLDARPVEPQVVESLDLHTGQKASVLITADQDVSSYWISITIRGRSAPRSASVIMRYDGASETPPSNSALQALKDSQPVWDDVHFTLTQQRSFRHLQDKRFPSPLPAGDVARRFVFLQTQERFKYDSDNVQYISNAPKKESVKAKQIGLKIGEGEERPENSCKDGYLRWAMGRVSKALPTVPVLHSLYYTDENDDLIEEYGYYKLELGKVYEIVIQNYPACNGVCETHSLHLHGYHFWVVGTYEGEYNGTLPAYGGAGTYLRDTTMIVGEGAAGKGMKPKERKGCGYTVIRFKADNPGVWPFHCHALWHTLMGQGAVFYFDKDTLPAPNLDHHMVCGNKITRAILSSAHKKTPSKKPAPPKTPSKKTAPPKSYLRTETTYKYKVIYPSCKRGYWDSGCGQPEMKQKAIGVKCVAITGNTESETDDEYCAGLIKPLATDRTCPKTKSCPRCKGCKRNGNCLKPCGGKAGTCSACDARDGKRMGACCQKGNKNDPIECKIAEYQFETDKVHTCALLPEDEHLADLLKDVVERVNKLEVHVLDLKKN